MLARRCVEDRLQLGMDRDGPATCRSSVGERQHAVADVLRSHADHVAAPLRSVEQQPERQPRLAADRMVRFEKRDLGVGPGVMTGGLDRRQFDATRRVVAHPALSNCELAKRAQRLHPVARRLRFLLREDRGDELLGIEPIG